MLVLVNVFVLPGTTPISGASESSAEYKLAVDSRSVRASVRRIVSVTLRQSYNLFGLAPSALIMRNGAYSNVDFWRNKEGNFRLPELFVYFGRTQERHANAGRALRCVGFALTSILALMILLPQMMVAQETGAAKSEGATLHGTVRDSAGKLVRAAQVVLRGESLRTPAETSTDASGGFTFAGVAMGTYTLTAISGPLHSSAVSITVSMPGGQPPVNLILGSSDAARSVPASADAGQAMQFADNPDFAIAAVTDWTAAGGHGSDASLRASEALTRDTVKLGLKDAQATAPGLPGDSHRVQGELDEKRGDPLSAVREFQQAASENPSESNYFAWGSELLIHRAVWQAKEVFDEGVRLYPESARMLAARGAALFAGALYDQAALDLCKASDLNPENADPYLFMGKIEIAAPHPLPCVVAKLERFETLQPNNSLAKYYYAMALWKQQDQATDPQKMGRVKDLLNKAVTLDPKCAEAYLQLGNLSAEKKQWEQAIGDYLNAIQADPKLSEAHYRLAVAYERIGQTEKATEQFQLHDEIARNQAAEIQRQREAVKQFQVVLPSKK